VPLVINVLLKGKISTTAMVEVKVRDEESEKVEFTDPKDNGNTSPCYSVLCGILSTCSKVSPHPT
jgi:hypothetical protein